MTLTVGRIDPITVYNTLRQYINEKNRNIMCTKYVLSHWNSHYIDLLRVSVSTGSTLWKCKKFVLQ